MNAWLDLPGFEEAVAHVVEATRPAVDEGFVDARAACWPTSVTARTGRRSRRSRR
jgi:hypothetical protein